jgi:RNA polymerase sigma-70 factor (ECF subfamily)
MKEQSSTDDRDTQDIADALDGIEEAFARLIQRYEKEIARQMWRFTRDADTLESLVHDVFVEAYMSLSGYRARSPFLHWLRRIATRVGYRHWKKNGRWARHEERQYAQEIRNGFFSENPEPSEAAEYVFYLLEKLPVDDRLVLTLLYFEQCDTREIANRTGWSVAKVKIRAWRARQKLVAMLEHAGYGRT